MSFSANSGELIAVIGVNGAGKSTLLRTLGAIQKELSGELLIKEKNTNTYTPQQLALEISVVLTEKIASKNLTVLELIALGRQPYTNWIGNLTEKDKTVINTAISKVDLLELKHKKCYELSDGQMQRVMIARALAQDTSIILLDEPTTHLDLYHKANILKLLKSITYNTNKTIIFTTHEIELGIQLCDKMLLLNTTNNPYGSPNELIEQKHFNSLFPEDTVTFNATTATFRVKK
ncbi:ABC transporter ATP-binding protein [Maribacter vaceletii]|uniref:ABC transporter ATP-binding protein n=1 Tax=Maribacter vaceletii TaxID=1206816 RepID=UPI00293747F9|nr:ABC transporter ATP-binding protein [Maribacter vaceletii]